MFRSNFNIVLSTEQLDKLNHIIKSADPNVRIISKKNSLYAPRFTLLKNKNGVIYLIGDGKRQEIANAYLGKGSSARVKVAVKIVENNGKYELTDDVYAVKILKDETNNGTSEYHFNLEINGFADLIKDSQGTKAYLIIQYVPGVTIAHLSDNQIRDEFKIILVALAKALVAFNRKCIIHRDLHAENIMYDSHTKKAALIDFEKCRFSKYPQAVETNCNRVEMIIDEIFLKYNNLQEIPLTDNNFKDVLNKIKYFVIEDYIKKQDKIVYDDSELILILEKNLDQLLLNKNDDKLTLPSSRNYRDA